jgi:hypothetical protein
VFQPGRSGNPGGRPKDKPFQDALRIEAKLAEEGEPCFAQKGSLRWNARQLLEQGDVQSIREIADRLDGKPAQSVEIDSETTIRIERIEYVVVEQAQEQPRLINGNGHNAPH